MQNGQKTKYPVTFRDTVHVKMFKVSDEFTHSGRKEWSLHMHKNYR